MALPRALCSSASGSARVLHTLWCSTSGSRWYGKSCQRMQVGVHLHVQQCMGAQASLCGLRQRQRRVALDQRARTLGRHTIKGSRLSRSVGTTTCFRPSAAPDTSKAWYFIQIRHCSEQSCSHSAGRTLTLRCLSLMIMRAPDSWTAGSNARTRCQCSIKAENLDLNVVSNAHVLLLHLLEASRLYCRNTFVNLVAAGSMTGISTQRVPYCRAPNVLTICPFSAPALGLRGSSGRASVLNC